MFLELVGKYTAANGLVYLPDPVSESDSGTLSSASTAATLDPFRHAVTLQVNQASSGAFQLEGDWFRCVDWDTPPSLSRARTAPISTTKTVAAFNCNPGTGMIWPTNFTSMGSLTIATAISAGSTVRVGPFLWTPSLVGHECLLAIVNGAADPAVTAALLAHVPHNQLVRFDNNVGQRNVNPQMSMPGGKTKAWMTMHGGLTVRQTRSSWTPRPCRLTRRSPHER
jgi:hypothetical protein